MGGWRAGGREGGDVSSGVSACVLTSSRYSSDPGRALTTEAATKTHVLGQLRNTVQADTQMYVCHVLFCC